MRDQRGDNMASFEELTDRAFKSRKVGMFEAAETAVMMEKARLAARRSKKNRGQQEETAGGAKPRNPRNCEKNEGGRIVITQYQTILAPE